jgi:hypothetical protein
MGPLVREFRWKLGIPADSATFAEWDSRVSRSSGYVQMAEGVVGSLAEYAALCFRYKLGLLADHVATREDVEAMEAFCRHFGQWMREAEGFRSNLVSRRIAHAVQSCRILGSNGAGAGREAGACVTTGNATTGAAQMEIGKRPQPPGTPAHPPSPLKAQYAARPANTVDGPAPAAANAGQWKYLPVPAGPDAYEEYLPATGKSPEGYHIVAGRVRGKKHKHEGTNCDDWFEFASADPWTVIAVSDGAGSAVLSRVGARASCEAAVALLRERLAGRPVTERDAWTAETFRRDDATGEFAEPDIREFENALHDAVATAFEAVAAEVADPEKSARRAAALGGRTPELRDFSATLLLAIHAVTKVNGVDHSFVLACQVGDGMTAAVDAGGGLKLLGVADSGEFSGETDFLTSAPKRERAHLRSKTNACCRPLRALMVMTDGVADDYFPQDPELLRLYADLVLNGVIATPVAPAAEALAAALADTPLAGEDEAARDVALATQLAAARVTEAGPQNVVLRSASELAGNLKLPDASRLAAKPEVLAAAARGSDGTRDERPPERRLLEWLDAYHVRGSFDDRTLVVMYPAGGDKP